jgi:hypothetical protein
MFRKFLEKDLKAIFEADRVEFSNSIGDFGQELGCLFVVIDPEGVKNNFREGENYFSVVGTLEFIQDESQTSFGFFNQRMALTKYEAAGNLRLLNRESNESLSNESAILLVKKSQKFSYRIAIPYNPPIGEIEELEIGTLSII